LKPIFVTTKLQCAQGANTYSFEVVFLLGKTYANEGGPAVTVVTTSVRPWYDQ